MWDLHLFLRLDGRLRVEVGDHRFVRVRSRLSSLSFLRWWVLFTGPGAMVSVVSVLRGTWSSSSSAALSPVFRVALSLYAAIGFFFNSTNRLFEVCPLGIEFKITASPPIDGVHEYTRYPESLQRRMRGATCFPERAKPLLRRQERPRATCST